MALETSAAIIAISLAMLSLVFISVLVALYLAIRRIMTVIAIVQRQAEPILATARETVETVRDMSVSARFQVRRFERLGDRIAQIGATYSALSHGVVVAMAALLKRKGV